MNTYHISASYQTAAGGFGSWSGEIMATSHEDALQRGEAQLRADRRRTVMRSLDMSAVERPESDRTKAYKAWRAAQDAWQHHVDTGEGDGPALSAAAKAAEAAFIQVHGNAS